MCVVSSIEICEKQNKNKASYLISQYDVHLRGVENVGMPQRCNSVRKIAISAGITRGRVTYCHGPGWKAEWEVIVVDDDNGDDDGLATDAVWVYV